MQLRIVAFDARDGKGMLLGRHVVEAMLVVHGEAEVRQLMVVEGTAGRQQEKETARGRQEMCPM